MRKIFRARSVVTMAGPPIENGAVGVDNDRIVDVGRFDDVRARNSGDVVDLGDRALLPGLINAHCHLDYTCLRGKIGPQKTFTDWIRAINAEKATLSPNELVDSIDAGFSEAKRFGTTTIANLTAFPELISQVPPPIRTIWFPELIDIREPVDLDRVASTSLAPHALYTASAGLFRACEQRADLLTTHLSESHEEMEMFCNADGELYEFLRALGRDMSDCGKGSPLQSFLSITDSSRLHSTVPPRQTTGVEVTKGWIVAHLNELCESDFGLLRRSRSKLHIVHCPRSHDYFGHSTFQFDPLRGLECNICLGTDSLASNDDLSVFAEMRTFAQRFPRVSAAQIVEMVTVNPARALGLDAGRIAPGAIADLIAIPWSGGADIYDQIVAFDGEPLLAREAKI